jgi:hypothetical protein
VRYIECAIKKLAANIPQEKKKLKFDELKRPGSKV